MAESIQKAVDTAKSYVENGEDINESTEGFLCQIFELIINFNLVVSNRQQAIPFYNLTLNLFTTVIYPAKDNFKKETLIRMSKCINAMYVWLSDNLISRHDMMIDDIQLTTDLAIIFANVLKFYRIVFESNVDQEEGSDDWEVKNGYIKNMAEFLMYTSNDVVSIKYPQTFQEISKDTINYLCNLINNFSQTHPVMIAQSFSRVRIY